MRKYLFLLSLVSSLLVTTASANNVTSNYQLGLGVGKAELDSAKSTSFKITAGKLFNISDILDVSTDLTYLSIGSLDSTYMSGTNYIKESVKNKSYIASASYIYKMSPYFNPLLKLGVQKYNIKATGTINGNPASLSKSGFGHLFGLGFKSTLTKDLSLLVEGEKHSLSSNIEDIKLVTITLAYKF